jgi:hypothetical protein
LGLAKLSLAPKLELPGSEKSLQNQPKLKLQVELNQVNHSMSGFNPLLFEITKGF